MESILTSIKKLLGIEKEYEHFDAELVMHINSVFTILNQLGVGPSEGFSIQDEDAIWDDYILKGLNIEAVKTYVYQKVKLIFDPPTNSALIEAMERSINQFEWRLNVAVDTSTDSGEEENQNG